MMNGENQSAIKKYMGVDAAKNLTAMGFSMGKDKGDVEFNAKGRTTGEVKSELMDALGLTED